MTKKKDNTIIKEAQIELKEIMAEAKKNAKEILATSMAVEIERIVKESLSKEIGDEPQETEKKESKHDEPESKEEKEEDHEGVFTEEELDSLLKELEGGHDEMDMRDKSDDEIEEAYDELGDEDHIDAQPDTDEKTEENDDTFNFDDEKDNTNQVVSEFSDEDKDVNTDYLDEEEFDMTEEEIMAALDEMELAPAVEKTEKFAHVPPKKRAVELDEIKLAPAVEKTEKIAHAPAMKKHEVETPYVPTPKEKEGKPELEEGHMDHAAARKVDATIKRDINKTHKTHVMRTAVVNESKQVQTLETKLHKSLTENEELKITNQEYMTLLEDYKSKLQELLVFNHNLAHVNKLFTEHATNKNEKSKIIKSFDDVKTIDESKKTYKRFASELTNTKLVETVEEKITNVKSSATSRITEATAYSAENPEITKMKSLINFMDNKNKQ